MSEIGVENIPVTCQSYGATSSGTVTVKTFGSAERTKRALRVGTMTLAATLGCVFIPVAHFILVPAGVLLTPIIAFVTWRLEAKVIASEVTCPACANTIAVASNPTRWPMSETCSSCQRAVQISKSS